MLKYDPCLSQPRLGAEVFAALIQTKRTQTLKF